MIEHVLDLGNQLKKELETSTDFVIDSYNDLLIVGMGGSGVAGDVLKLVLNEITQINVEVRKAYGIPDVVAKRRPKCLFISYSGNTEETVEAVNDAIKYNLDWSVISSGGQLLELATQHNRPFVKVPSKGFLFSKSSFMSSNTCICLCAQLTSSFPTDANLESLIVDIFLPILLIIFLVFQLRLCHMGQYLNCPPYKHLPNHLLMLNEINY